MFLGNKIIHEISKEQVRAIERETEAKDSPNRRYYTGVAVGCEYAIEIIKKILEIPSECEKTDESDSKISKIFTRISMLREQDRRNEMRKTFCAEFMNGYVTAIIDAENVVRSVGDERS